MSNITPIPDIQWIRTKAGKLLKSMYGTNTRYALRHLPNFNIEPEHVAVSANYDPEFMLACLVSGAWLNGDDWRLIARYTIAKRLRMNASLMFIPPFDEHKQTILEYQLEGGTFKTRDTLAALAGRMIQSPLSPEGVIASARVVLSLTSPKEMVNLIQPFHWIRVVAGTAEEHPVFRMNAVATERRKQKVTLCSMLRAST